MPTENIIDKYLKKNRELHKNLKTKETYVNNIILSIIKQNQVDTKKLVAWGNSKGQDKYVNDVFIRCEMLEDDGILYYDEESSTFKFTNEEKKEELFNKIKESVDKIAQKQNDNELFIPNQYVKHSLRESYDKLKLDTVDDRLKFIKSMVYFNNFSFNNIINLHTQLIDKNEDFKDSIKYYKTFNYYKKEGVRVLKGSKTLRAFVPKRIPLYVKENGEYKTDEKGNRIPLRDENGKYKFAKTFAFANVFEFEQTNFGLNYLNADKTQVARALAEKGGVVYRNEYDSRGDFFITSFIAEQLEKLSDNPKARYLSLFILSNRLGLELNDKEIIDELDDMTNLNKEDLLTLFREVNSISRSFEKKYNFDDILKNATDDTIKSKADILLTYSISSREDRKKHIDIIDKEIKSRVLQVKEKIGIDLKNHVKFDTVGNATGANIIGVKIFGVEDDLMQSIDQYIKKIKESQEFKDTINKIGNSELEEISDKINKEVKEKDVYIKSENKELAKVKEIEKEYNEGATVTAKVINSNDTVYQEYDKAQALKQDIDRGTQTVKLSDKDTKLSTVKPFVSDIQYDYLKQDTFKDSLDNLYEKIITLPKIYATEDLDDTQKSVKLHYFNSSSDWYIIEKDTTDEQKQAFGYVVLNGDTENAELGYIDIEELKSNNVEIDFHWEEKSLYEVKLTHTMSDIPIMDIKDITREYINEMGFWESDSKPIIKLKTDDKEYIVDTLNFKDITVFDATDGMKKLPYNTKEEVWSELIEPMREEQNQVKNGDIFIRDNKEIIVGSNVIDKNYVLRNYQKLTGAELKSFNEYKEKIDEYIEAYNIHQTIYNKKVSNTKNKYGYEEAKEFLKKEGFNIGGMVREEIYFQNIAEVWAKKYLFTKKDKTSKDDKPSIKVETEKIGAKTKFRRNIEALEVIEKLETGADIKDLTAEDKQKLAKYTGWGGIPQAFRKFNGEITKGWEKEVEELESLLGKEKIEEIRKTVLTSFYTPTQIADGMIKAVEDMGFKGGRILEPSVGIGNILTRLPSSIRQQSKIDAVEKDKTTAQIAKIIMPNVNVITSGFEKAPLKENYYNLIIGNPPFGDIKIPDDDKELNNLTLHNYFMAKSAKHLKEGGIMAMVVSSYFLDSKDKRARESMSKSCNLLGAIRLPNNAFGDTEVTTDVLFFQKRTPEMQNNSEEWLEVSELNDTPINKYYTAHQDNLLGKWGKYGTMYGGEQPALKANPNQDTISLFNQRLANLPKGIYQHQSIITVDEKEDTEREVTIDNENKLYDKALKLKKNCYMVNSDGTLLYKKYNLEKDEKVIFAKADSKLNAKAEKVPLSDKEIERIKAILEVVETAEELRDMQLDDTAKDSDIEEKRAELNRVYDSFVKKYKFLNSSTNKRIFKEDARFAYALSLEKDYTKAVSKAQAERTGAKPRAESAEKADIFTKRTQYPYKIPTKAENSLDALTMSLAEKGAIHISYMKELTGFDEDKIIDDLIAIDAIYLDPSVGWVTKDEYLSGDVKTKLEEATEERNIKALQTVIPEDLKAHEITVSCGASWIPREIMRDFVKHISQSDYNNATYIDTLATWKVSCGETNEARRKYGTERRSVEKIIEASLNNIQIKIYDKNADGKRVLNEPQSQLANAKADLVKEEWKKWVYKDDDRRDTLVKIYNQKFNRLVERKFDGSILPFRGLSDSIELRKHQKDFVRKFVEGKGVNLADHSVGTGKTFTAQACVMEAKRMGKASKALVVVPNQLTEQWGREWLQLYPNANVLVATENDFSPDKRAVFLNKIATNDWDAVVIGHSQLVKIGVSKEYQQEYIKSQISDLEKSLAILEEQDGKSFTTKQVEAKIEKLEIRLSKIMDKEVDTTLEDLGIDMVVVDEAHKFKNLAYTTSLTNVGSLGNPAGATKAEDLFMKTQALLDRTNNRNLLFLTGTPVSNTIAEMYTMQRYMQYDKLKEMGISHFDSWVKQFAEVTTEFELKANGQYEPKARLSKFHNVPELIKQYKTFADIVTREDVIRDAEERGVDLKIPKIKGGKPTNVVLEPSDTQREMIGIEDEDGNYNEGSLIYRAIQIQGKKPEKGEDNILTIIGESKKVALDPRIVNPDAPDSPNSKVNVMIEHSLELYKKYDEDKGTMLIFCDLSVPKKAKNREKEKLDKLFDLAENGTEDERLKAEKELSKMSNDEINAILSNSDFSVYDDIKSKLIAKGVPENEIAFIHDAKTTLQKQALFEKVKKGEVRYLLGSTSKMGEGMNVQERLVGLFHLDAPWRPSDIEQREGRIIRQGNKLYEKYGDDFEITIERFATKGTLDSQIWETLERKQVAIEQIKKGSSKERKVDDISSESATMADMKASASGNPYILEEVKLKRDIKMLNNLKEEHDRSIFEARDKIRSYEKKLSKADEELAMIDEDVKSAKEYLSKLSSNEIENEAIKKENKRIKELNKQIQKENKDLPENKKKDLLPLKPLLPTFKVEIDGEIYTERTEAGAKIDEIVEEMRKKNLSFTTNKVKFGDFNVYFEYEKDSMNLLNSSIIVTIEGKTDKHIVIPSMKFSGAGACTRILNKFAKYDNEAELVKYSYDSMREELPILKQTADSEFEKEGELEILKRRYTLVVDSLKYKRDTYYQEAVKTFTADKILKIDMEEDMPTLFTVTAVLENGKTVTKSVLTDNKSLAEALFKQKIEDDKTIANPKNISSIEINKIDEIQEGLNERNGQYSYKEHSIDYIDPFYDMSNYLIKQDSETMKDANTDSMIKKQRM